MANEKVALVTGAGDATGGAISRRFAREGYVTCVTRRNADKLQPLVARIEAEGGKARAFGSDARKEEQVTALVETIEREIGPIEVAVYNVGGNVRFPIREMTSRVYFKTWEMGCFGGFLMPFMRDNFPERYALKEQEGILDPEAVAENYWRLHLQPKSAWTHELDLRPWIEKW